jgi:tight adherence protein B
MASRKPRPTGPGRTRWPTAVGVTSGSLAIVALVLGGAAARAQEQSPVEIASIDAAAYPTVTAVVTAPTGLAGVDYSAEAFEVLENGQPVKSTVDRIPTSTLEVILVFDTSGSMQGAPLAAAQDAAEEFLAVMPPEVRVGIVGFGPAPTLLAAPTVDRGSLAAQLANLTADGETALYDAVVQATSQFSPEVSDRAVVLLSDGGDTASGADLRQAEAAASGATVNVIELVTPESNRAALEQLATAGGGTVSSASDPAALTDLYQATAQALVNRYRITYSSAGHGATNLTVRLTTNEGTREATKQVELPSAPAPPPVPEPSADLPPERAVPAPPETSTSPARSGLLVGAAAVFLALLVLGLVALPADRRARLTAARLSATHAVAEGPSVSQVTQRLTAATERLLDRRGQRQRLATALEVAGISLRPGEYVLLAAAVTLVAAFAAFAIAGLIGLLVALVIGPPCAWLLVSSMADRRRAQFAELLPDNLQLLTGTLRSGYGLLQALATLGREASEPARGEFRRVLLEVRVGRDPGDSLRALADRMGSDDFDWVVGAIDINREVGGDLAMILDNVAETIRERQRLQRQVKSLSAEGRLSGYVLTALPPVLALVMAAINPDYLAELGSGFGPVLVVAGAVLLVIGWIWIRRLTRLTF